MNTTDNNAPEDNTPAPEPKSIPTAASTPESPPPPPSPPTPASLAAISEMISGFVGKLVSLATRALTPKLVRRVNVWARIIGNYAVLAGIVLTLVYAIVAGVRFKSFVAFAVGVGLALGIVIAHYAAGRFMASSDKIISGTPGRISSMAFLECIGLFLLLGAIASFFGGIYLCIQLSSAVPLVWVIVVAPLLKLAAAIALNPSVIGIEQGDASAGEEALGLISFALKIWLKLVPSLFCLLAVAGCVVTVWGLFDSRGAGFNLSGMSGGMPLPFIGWFLASGMAGPALVLYACVTPVIVYLSFIFWSLGIDLARAILVIPDKLDNLKK